MPGLSVQRPVRALLVVVVAELIEDGLQFVDRGRRMSGQVFLELCQNRSILLAWWVCRGVRSSG